MKLEYKIIEAGNARTLEERVTAHLLIGWKLCGGVFLMQTPKVYAQAVAK